MFLLAHVNFFALKLSRIKECVDGGATEGGAPASSDCSSCDNSLSVVSQTICPAVGRRGSCEVALCQHTGTAAQQRHVQTVDELKKQHQVSK